jgi:hypothetical protein
MTIFLISGCNLNNSQTKNDVLFKSSSLQEVYSKKKTKSFSSPKIAVLAVLI